MTDAEKETALRRYAACDVSWRELQEMGFADDRVDPGRCLYRNQA